MSHHLREVLNEYFNDNIINELLVKSLLLANLDKHEKVVMRKEGWNMRE
jgi:hypothetical protein